MICCIALGGAVIGPILTLFGAQTKSVGALSWSPCQTETS